MDSMVTRRTFIAGLASVGAAACATQPPSGETSQAAAVVARTEQPATHPLTVYFTGLIFFQPNASEMKIGFLGHDHETIVVARKSDVDTPGADLNGDQYQGWNTAELSMDMADLTYWKGTSLAMTVASTEPLTVESPMQLFPLKTLSKMSPTLSAGPGGNCQSLLSIKNGDFRGRKRTHSCGHEEADFKMVRNAADTAPVLTTRLRDTVQYRTQRTAASFAVDGKTVALKPGNAAIWVLQIDKNGATGDPREIKHAQHYYSLLSGYTGELYYPRRDSIPDSCRVQVDVDPIYCTPAEDR